MPVEELQVPLASPTPNVTDLLGTDPLALPVVGLSVHEEIANRWLTFTKNGIVKEERKELINKHPIVGNVPSLNPPKLNPEIEGCATEHQLKQDKFLGRLQEQLASAISALAVPFNSFFCSPTEETNIHLSYLADATRLLTDLHHSLSQHRRFEISKTVNQDIKKSLMDMPMDTLLFGTNLSSNIKSSQELKKASEELKPKSVRTSVNSPRSWNQASTSRDPSFFARRPPTKNRIPRYKRQEGGRITKFKKQETKRHHNYKLKSAHQK